MPVQLEARSRLAVACIALSVAQACGHASKRTTAPVARAPAVPTASFAAAASAEDPRCASIPFDGTAYGRVLTSSEVIRPGSRKAVFAIRAGVKPDAGQTFALIDEHGFSGLATITSEDCGPRSGQCFDDCPPLVCAELAEPSHRSGFFAPFGVGPVAHPLPNEKAKLRTFGCVARAEGLLPEACTRPTDAAGWIKEAAIDLDGDSRSDLEIFSRDCGPFVGGSRLYAVETRVRKGNDWHVTQRVLASQ